MAAQGFLGYAPEQKKYGAMTVVRFQTWAVKFSHFHSDAHYLRLLMTCVNGGKPLAFEEVESGSTPADVCAALHNAALTYVKGNWSGRRFWDTDSPHTQNIPSWGNRKPALIAEYLDQLLIKTESYFLRTCKGESVQDLVMDIATFPYNPLLNGCQLDGLHKLLAPGHENQQKSRTIIARAFALLQKDATQADFLRNEIEKIAKHPALGLPSRSEE